jgi:hypothetical protein
MTTMRWMALLVGLSGCAAASAAAPGYTVAGVVVEHLTNRPVERVLLTLTATDRSGRQGACLSEANGSFQFENVARGKYTLAAERPGGLPETFRGSEGFVTGIAVGPGRDSEHIVFPLTTGARLSGTVTDQDGEPVQNARVYLFRKGVLGGSMQINLQGNGQTNKAGRFHFSRLPEGTYYVAIAAQPWYSSAFYGASRSTNMPPELNLTYPITYYAGALDPGSASPITLTEGSSTNIQIALPSVPASTVVLDGAGDPSKGSVGAWVSATGPGGYPIMLPANQMFRDGHLELAGMAPGDYTLTLGSFRQGPPAILSQEHVSVRGGADAVVSDEPFAKVSGKIVFTPPDRPPEIQIALFSMGLGMGPREVASIHPDGSFEFDSAGVPAGRYRLQLMNAPEFRIVSLAAKETAFDGSLLELKPGASVELSVAAARAESRVAGIAIKDGQPFAGAMVLLVPADQNTAVYIGRDQSDSDGTFSILSVPAGRYFLLAIDDGRDLAYRDRSVMEPYWKSAQTITAPVAGEGPVRVNVVARKK